MLGGPRVEKSCPIKKTPAEQLWRNNSLELQSPSYCFSYFTLTALTILSRITVSTYFQKGNITAFGSLCVFTNIF